MQVCQVDRSMHLCKQDRRGAISFSHWVINSFPYLLWQEKEVPHSYYFAALSLFRVHNNFLLQGNFMQCSMFLGWKFLSCVGLECLSNSKARIGKDRMRKKLSAEACGRIRYEWIDLGEERRSKEGRHCCCFYYSIIVMSSQLSHSLLSVFICESASACTCKSEARGWFLFLGCNMGLYCRE